MEIIKMAIDQVPIINENKFNSQIGMHLKVLGPDGREYSSSREARTAWEEFEGLYQRAMDRVIQASIEPQEAWPFVFDPVTHLRTSPDVKRFRDTDGVWYHSNGIRDDYRSPKQISDLI
jgi:hypothetical protein